MTRRLYARPLGERIGEADSGGVGNRARRQSDLNRRIPLTLWLVLVALSVLNLNVVAHSYFGKEKYLTIPTQLVGIVCLFYGINRSLAVSRELCWAVGSVLWYCAYGALVSPHMRDADLDLLRSFLTNALLLVCTCRITYFVTAGRKLWRERLLWLTYVMGFLATVSVFLGFFVAGWQESVSTSGYRQAGVFVNPNTASFQVLFFIATGFALAASRARVHWVTATLLIAAPAILATSSRTGIIGFLSIPLGLAVIAFPGRNTNRAIITILVSALIVGGGLAYGYRKAANVDQAKRIRETIALVSLAVNGKLDRENTSARTIIFSRAIEMIRYAPITGNGFGRMSRMPGLGVGPHNMFLLFLGEVGVLGTIPIVIAAYCYLKLGHHTDVRWQKVMVLGYFACEFLSSMTSHNVFTDRPATCMLGVSLGILHSSETDIRSVLERRRRAGRTVPTEQSE